MTSRLGILASTWLLVAGTTMAQEGFGQLGDLAQPAPTAGAECKCETAAGAPKFFRSTQTYKLPNVHLITMDNRDVSLAKELQHEGPVIVQFFFSSCATLCPALTGSLAQAQKELGPQARTAKILSISIDPRFDRPATLKSYAKQFAAPANWHFYTGSTAEIITVRKAFQAYQPNKMQHEPLTFIRATADKPWIRLNGLLSGQQLAHEFRQATKKGLDE